MGLGPKPTAVGGMSQLKNSAAMERENDAKKKNVECIYIVTLYRKCTKALTFEFFFGSTWRLR
jgi:hypothetical protein